MKKSAYPPTIILSGRVRSLAIERGLSQWHLSVTHDGDLTLALAIGMAEAGYILGAGIDLTAMFLTLLVFFLPSECQ